MEALQDLPNCPAREALHKLVPRLLQSIYVDDFTHPECATPYFAIVANVHKKYEEAEARRKMAENNLDDVRKACELEVEEQQETFKAALNERLKYKRAIDECFTVKSDLALMELKSQRLEETLSTTISKNETILKTTFKHHLEEKLANEEVVTQLNALKQKKDELQNELETEKEKSAEAFGILSKQARQLQDYEDKEKSFLQALEKGETDNSHFFESIRQVRPDLFVQLSGMTDQQKGACHGLVLKIAQRCSDALLEQLKGKDPDEASDALMDSLKTLSEEHEVLVAQQTKHNDEIHRLTELAPHWNKELVDDVRNHFLRDLRGPMTSIVSHRDTRPFAGLGLAKGIPPFLQVEGFVKHRFVSLAELKHFLNSFWSWRKKKNEDVDALDFESQLAAFLAKTFPKQPNDKFEFAYALVHSLGTHTSDPDLWMVGQIINRTMPISAIEDQMEMLKHIEKLLVLCDVTPSNCELLSGTRPKTFNNNDGDSKKGPAKTNLKIINAVVVSMFPVKTSSRLNALRLALYKETRNSNGKIAVSELMLGDGERTQSCFIEELRKQYCAEIVEFQEAFVTNMRKLRSDHTFAGVETQEVIAEMEPDPEWRSMWEKIPATENNPRSVLKKFQQERLFRPSNLWIAATPVQVTNLLSESSCALKTLNWADQAPPPTMLECVARDSGSQHSMAKPPARTRRLGD